MIPLLQLKQPATLAWKATRQKLSNDNGPQTGSSSGSKTRNRPNSAVIEQTVELWPQQSKVSLEDEDETNFPDGGLPAYMALLGSFMGLLPAWGVTNSLGALEGYISKHQLASSSSSGVSWIFSIYLTLFSASCVLTGAYFDRNGGFVPLCVGSVVFVCGLMATANCQTIWQFILSFSVVTGLATGALTTPLIGCIATWFSRKRAMATSLATIGGSLGGIVFPLMLKSLYEEVGFPWAIRIMAFVCLACLSVACVFARVNEKTRPIRGEFRSRSEKIRFYVLGSFNIRYFQDRKYLLTTLAFSLAENSIMATNTFIASYAMTRGNSEGKAFTLITVSNAVQILGRYIPGYISDKYTGRFNTVILVSCFAGILNLTLLLPFGGNQKVLWAYMILYGFASGSVMSLTAVCVAQISRTCDFGKRYSTSYLLSAIMTLPIIPICGAIIGKGTVAEYNKFIVFTSVLILVGSACYLGARYLCVGAKMRKF
ncbi:LAME_0F19614g1_1 [Lachancea meyersii CBS 8951]|uniref:LAME_0F19614g1_1 n=1 Tax=Lachancea meyersii CBS 8951 TaxID=1266667 RepID=A0A1G4K1S0_9SACH|nr:LAME_0F19614g1_1 [Lachancea meyersii CBS 8951]